MAGREIMAITGIVLDESTSVTLGELCRGCGISAEFVFNLVAEGLLEPAGRDPTRWRFPAEDVTRVQAALRLQRDMELNLPGAALALDLLDEVQRLRSRVRTLERLLGIRPARTR